MKSTCKKTISLMLVIMMVLTIGAFSMTASAANEGKNAKINCGIANLREGPGLEYNRIAQVTRGRVYAILGSGTDRQGQTWYKIKYNNSEAWVLGSLTKVVDPSAPTTNSTKIVTIKSNNTNIRSAPSKNATRVANVKKGTTYIYLGEVGSYYKIKRNGQAAYVLKNLAKVETVTVSG